MGDEFRSSAFRTFERESYVERAGEVVTREPHHFRDGDLVDGFCASLERLGRMCQSVAEVQYLAMMRQIARSFNTDVTESKCCAAR